ncbi:MAG TPA: glycosyltransferase family 9 protein [Sphingomonas sp.]|uniref:glycosyltransferase family 9 protein n=1 Tax=Sphingomonas sp. TaxID=28214 RepID=UPI002B7900C5|nr:glycosyltransferase family 9 protein [Sphingomonas sp.]HMI20220.1 glycosyltransferase family 9 protein [Sphingomonas sp.]
MLPRLIRTVIGEIPSRSRAGVARRLIVRANAARDARQYRVAAALYEEALRFNPENARIRIQCGHMLKDSGDLDGAEEQYARAAIDLPNDADLALQIGHFYKIAGRPEKAEASYARALALNPGWREAERELVSVGGAVDGASIPHAGQDWVVPEVLPRGDEAPPAVDRNILRLFRLGGRRAHSRWGDLKVMRGIEAIRGYRLAPGPLSEIRLLIDDKLVHSEPLQAYPVAGGSEPQTKYVFNIWHDFSSVAPGRHVIELAFHDASGRRVRRHRETILVAPPLDEDTRPDSDALVALPAEASSIEDAINARPSMVRTTERRLLPDPVRTILVQRVDQLGDLVCSVPAIRRLRALFPDARLIGLMTSANAVLAEQLALFDEVVAIDFSESPSERRRVLPLEAQDRLRRTLGPYAFDIAIDLGEGDASRALLLLSGARFLYGFKDRQSPWLDAGLDFNVHDPVNGIEIVPPSRKMLLLVEGLGIMAQGQAKPLANPDRAGLAALGIAEGQRYAVIHAGARLAYTRWPYFADLMRMLLERTDLKIVLFADDMATAERALAEGEHSTRVHVIAGQLAFAQFDALLAHCALFVGNDSGPKHLAALRGAPVVSLHMARLNWSEWGQEMTGRIISRRVPCAGCGIGLDGEDCGKDFACLRHIRPEEVFAAAQDLLETAI